MEAISKMFPPPSCRALRPTLSCRALARHPSLRSGRRPIRHFVRDGVPRGETPRLAPRGDKKRGFGATALFCRFERSEKSPHPVMPLPPVVPRVARHPSLRSGRRPIHVIPRHASAERSPRLAPRGDKKRGFGATKK
jgi:hypothetical protein